MIGFSCFHFRVRFLAFRYRYVSSYFICLHNSEISLSSLFVNVSLSCFSPCFPVPCHPVPYSPTCLYHSACSCACLDFGTASLCRIHISDAMISILLSVPSPVCPYSILVIYRKMSPNFEDQSHSLWERQPPSTNFASSDLNDNKLMTLWADPDTCTQLCVL
jgi:hypothetical protein